MTEDEIREKSLKIDLIFCIFVGFCQPKKSAMFIKKILYRVNRVTEIFIDFGQIIVLRNLQELLLIGKIRLHKRVDFLTVTDTVEIGGIKLKIGLLDAVEFPKIAA